MNTKTAFIAMSIIGGLIGLGLVANSMIEQAEFGDREKEKDPSKDFRRQGEKKKQDAAYSESKESPGASAPSPEPIKDKPSPDEREVTLIPSSPSNQPKADEFPLRLGSKGSRVERLQVFLLRNYGHSGEITGCFDEQTETELKRRMNRSQIDETTFAKYRMGKHVHEQVIIW